MPPSRPLTAGRDSSNSRNGEHEQWGRSRSRTRDRSPSRDRSRSPICVPSPARSGVSSVRQVQSGSTDRTRSKCGRQWEDILEFLDYSEVVHFNDSDNEGQPPSKLVKVSEATKTFLKVSCTTHLPNSGHLQIRDAYSLPQVPATRTPQLDSYLKPEISQQGKAADKELAKVQTFVLDSLAPPSHLMELDTQGHEISHNEALSAASGTSLPLNGAGHSGARD